MPNTYNAVPANVIVLFVLAIVNNPPADTVDVIPDIVDSSVAIFLNLLCLYDEVVDKPKSVSAEPDSSSTPLVAVSYTHLTLPTILLV